STPIECDEVAPELVVPLVTVVSTAEFVLAAPAAAVGTSWNASGAAGAAGAAAGAGAAAAASAVAAGVAAFAASAAAAASGCIEVLKSLMILRVMSGASVGFGSTSDGSPMCAAITVSGLCIT